jgi:pyruvate/2-oxoacid:ferredoxin oxidoreductase alpha subunit
MRLLSNFQKAADREIKSIEEDESLDQDEKDEMIKEILEELEEMEKEIYNDDYWDQR